MMTPLGLMGIFLLQMSGAWAESSTVQVNVPSSSISPSSSALMPTFSSSEIEPFFSSEYSPEMSTVSPTESESPSMVSSTEPIPGSTSSIIQSSKSQPTSSFIPTPRPSVTPEKVIVVKCGEECKALKRRLYAASVFAILFSFTSLVFIFLLCRQCRISKEYNDPALSRLI